MTDPWQELYGAEYPRLVRALTAMSGDPSGAEDAAQEAFVRAYRHGLTRIERPGAWLLVVGSRALYRSRGRLRRELPWPEHLEPPRAGGQDEAADRADLLAALRQLPERQRAIVVARYYYGLSYAEIAQAFAVREGTVGATLSQGLANLRRLELAGRLASGIVR